MLVKLCYPKVKKEVRSERRVTSSTEKHKTDQVGTYWSHGQCMCDSSGYCRPLNSYGATVRLAVSAVISRSHGGGLISHGLLSLSTSDLPINTTGGFSRLSEC